MRFGVSAFIPGVALIICGGSAYAQDGMPGPGRCYVTDKPYSAVVEVENMVTLEKAGHIIHKNNFRKVYRDSAGRTRVESYSRTNQGDDSTAVLMFVSIHDPLAEMTYELNPQDHTAEQHNDDRGAWPHENPCPANWAPALPPQKNLAPSEANSSTDAAPNQPMRRQISFEQLGTQEMEGLEVTGTKRTVTYPVGAVNNDQPFDVVSERWFATELGITVLAKTNDPRIGESTNRTTNIERSEPDPALFQVPDDYTMKKDEPEARQ